MWVKHEREKGEVAALWLPRSLGPCPLLWSLPPPQAETRLRRGQGAACGRVARSWQEKCAPLTRSWAPPEGPRASMRGRRWQ